MSDKLFGIDVSKPVNTHIDEKEETLIKSMRTHHKSNVKLEDKDVEKENETVNDSPVSMPVNTVTRSVDLQADFNIDKTASRDFGKSM